MLQVAFGQSKYYSDNLRQNVERGMRQKLRRGEWLTKAPFGYVNNPRTRNIEPDPVKSRIIVRAFEEYAKRSHTLISLGAFLAEHGVTTKAGKPLAKASIKRILTNRAYLGFTKHRDEYFDGSFAPILSPTLFATVQEKLATRATPRKSKQAHDFPFTGLFRCGECRSMITAQWATGKCGGRYRYYRCTKKSGYCSQGYLREDLLATQVKAQLQTVSLPEAWSTYMLKKVETLEHEEKSASGNRLEGLKQDMKSLETKLDTLIDLHLSGDIERDQYLKKKDALMREKVSLQSKASAQRAERKEWVEPLRKWILDSKHGGILAESSEYTEIRDFVRNFGTNPVLQDKTISFSFCPPSVFVSACMARGGFALSGAPAARPASVLSSKEVAICDPTGNRTPVSWMRTMCPSR
jgi:site-specific DNA recombinase